MARFYKVLVPGRKTCNHDTTFQYPRVGTWTKPERVLPCVSGYHVVTAEHVGNWLGEPREVWEVEVRGDRRSHGYKHRPDKWAYEQVRLIRRVLTTKRAREFFYGRNRALRDFLYEDAKKHPVKGK